MPEEEWNRLMKIAELGLRDYFSDLQNGILKSYKDEKEERTAKEYPF